MTRVLLLYHAVPVFTVTRLVQLLIAVTNNSAISGAVSNCTHGVTHTTPPVKSPKIATLVKRDSLMLILWGVSTGDDSTHVDTVRCVFSVSCF